MSENQKETEEIEIAEAECGKEEAKKEDIQEEPANEAPKQKTAEEKLSELNDRYIRLAAEYDNFRKRSIKEREATHSDAIAYAIMQILPIYDNIELAIEHSSADEEHKKGIELILKQMEEAFKKLNVCMIEAERATAFDPNLHDAVMHIEDETLGENQIAEVFKKGFKIHDKVVRHAMVKVAN